MTPLLPVLSDSSLLLRVIPPLCSASVLSSSWGFQLDFSLIIGTTGSHVPHNSPKQDHAAFMPDAAQPASRRSAALFPRSRNDTWFRHRLFFFRHLIGGSLTFVFLFPTCHDLCRDFSLYVNHLDSLSKQLRAV